MTAKPLKIGITGISGRLGSLVAAQLHRDHEVVGIDRRPATRVPQDIPVHCIDIRRKRCEGVFRKERFDAVIHLNVLHSPRAKSRVVMSCGRFATPATGSERAPRMS